MNVQNISLDPKTTKNMWCEICKTITNHIQQDKPMIWQCGFCGTKYILHGFLEMNKDVKEWH